MIKEYCDRCNAPVGKMYDGGPDVPKVDLERALALIGRRREYVVCPKCMNEFMKAVRTYFRL